jgi:hypothetical protein
VRRQVSTHEDALAVDDRMVRRRRVRASKTVLVETIKADGKPAASPAYVVRDGDAD